MNHHPEAPRSIWPGDGDVASPVRQPRQQMHHFPAQAVWCASLPEQVAPQLAEQAPSAPEMESAWLYEVLFDGHRVLTRIDEDEVRMFGADGTELTPRLRPLQRSLEAMRLLSGWYDGELVLLDERGTPDARALHQAMSRTQIEDVVLVLFDLPFLDNYDLRAAPLLARRAMLERLLEERANSEVRLSEAFAGPASTVLPAACALGLPGLVAKRKEAPYRAGHQADWLLLRCGSAGNAS